MKSEIDKMRTGEFYDLDDPVIIESVKRAKILCSKLQVLTTYDEKYREIITELIPTLPNNSVICPPFICDHIGGIHIGEFVFINHNCIMLNSGDIYIGNHTLIGPSCGIYTPEHPHDFLQRRKNTERALPIYIGNDCWLGGGVIICPGVRIGDRCIIAAGSVVTTNIPSDSLAAGVPAVVKKRLG